MRSARIVIVVMLLAALGAAVLLYNDQQFDIPPEIAGVHTGPPQAIGWIPYWDQEAAVASFKADPSRFTHIGVFWHALLRNGSIGRYPHAEIDPALVAFAHEHGIKVIAIVANLPTEDEGGDWDAQRVARVISEPDARQRHITDIVALLKQYNFDGVHIDYEALPRKQRKNLTEFTKELATVLHREGKTVSVALHPKVGEYNSRWSNGSQAQDWKQLSRYADRLHLMLFQEHWESSDPGPAASLPWALPVLRYAQKHIPADKLFVGIPLYGYDWPENQSGEGLTHVDVQELIDQHTPAVKWDAKATSHYFTYQNDGRKHEVWFEDRRSVEAKLQAYRAAGVTNFTYWRLGHEDTRVWELLLPVQ